MELDERLISVVPAERQIRLQQLGFYAFIHFGINTFTDREWGDGTEDPSVFSPAGLDEEQWVKAVVSAGMKGLILTCKHHDGFCLWDTKLTDHNVMKSPCARDIVKGVSMACKKHGIAFGVYLSPWDRNCPLYGSGKAYDDFFVGQLTELLTDYGDIFSVWLDGACGEGPNGKKQFYDWERYYNVIRKLQPDASISVCGPDVRWCGNEAGHTRSSEWSVVPLRTRDTEKIMENSQQEDSEDFRRKIRADDEDLGSRKVLTGEKELIWYPAEVNTSIRPGWFWHKNENGRVKALEELFDIYLKSVGGNSTFLLNVPPAKEGLIHQNDVKRLGELGKLIRSSFAENLAPKAEITAGGKIIRSVVDDSYDEYFMPTGRTAEINIKLPCPERLGYLEIKENIRLSQRIESFAVDVFENGFFREIYSASVVGFRRIIALNGVLTDRLRIRVTDSRVAPTVSFIGIYRSVDM